ncbi:MAG: dihydrodipicolinate reductase C-terminal domain-containing protein [archaeon]
MAKEKIPVMVNGLSDTGKMANAVCEEIRKQDDMYAVGYSLTGPETPSHISQVGFTFLIRPSARGDDLKLLKRFENLVMVDFTAPNAVNENADFYCENGFNFVMGTTGGDRKALEQRVLSSEVCAVIAPNMAKQIVALQEFLENYASANKDSMKGYELKVRESHQKGKKDTSGTARAIIDYFNMMGIDFSIEEELKKELKLRNFTMIREHEEQILLGVPVAHLGGHGWHSYNITAPEGKSKESLDKLKRAFYDEFFHDNPVFEDYKVIRTPEYQNAVSADKSVRFEFKAESPRECRITHNVNGRSIYALGVIDAIRFLDRRINEGKKGKVYSMIDVKNPAI